VYSRFTNPTVSRFQDRLAALEGAEACVATASGMSAILSLVMALCSSGDHIVASTGLFGATQQLLGTIMPRFGIQTSFVAQTDVAAWQAAMRPETKLFFLETPSNPLTEIADIAALVASRTRRACWWRSITASVRRFCSDRSISAPIWSSIRRPSSSMARGGFSAAPSPGRKVLTDEVFKFLRTAGPTLSAFNAWVLLKGLETLQIRLEAQSSRRCSWRVAGESPRVARVYYPGLPSHPQFDLARRQQKSGGAIVSFTVKGARAEAWKVVDSCRLLSITANLGDTKTTLTHPASTTHGRITPEQRAAAGIGEDLAAHRGRSRSRGRSAERPRNRLVVI
jgi:O-succinylhomoserine sulfhydrylase